METVKMATKRHQEVKCFNCFVMVDREDSVRKQSVYFCDWDCCDEFFEKLAGKQKSAEKSIKH